MSSRNDPNAIVFGQEPRANLLPPEVHLRARARSTRRTLAFLVVVSMVIAGAGTALAFVYAAAAQATLAAAHAQTASLAAEKLEYAKASSVVEAVEVIRVARQRAVENEIAWADLMDEIATYVPEGVLLDSVTLEASLPWAEPLGAQGPLSAPRIATVTLVYVSESLLDTTQIVRDLSGLPGFVGASPESVTDTDAGFSTRITLNLGVDAVTDRFATEQEAANE